LATVTAYDCMTPEEYASWREAWPESYKPVRTPCVDCTWDYHREQVALGLCERRPSSQGRPMAGPKPTKPPQQGIRYSSESERVAARRAAWRRYKERTRA
jgi:hypothetical protein